MALPTEPDRDGLHRDEVPGYTKLVHKEWNSYTLAEIVKWAKENNIPFEKVNISAEAGYVVPDIEVY
jgi:hypothetical protein